MKKIVLTVAAVSSLALGACGGDDDPKVDLTPDAMVGVTPDAMDVQVCNPVTQAGCATGEKCGELIIVADDQATPADEFLAQIACVPDGDITEGVACADGVPGQDTGFDNCVATLDCFQGVCTALCGSSPDTCLTDPPAPFGMGESCANNFQNHFNDTTGVCLAACDPTVDTVVPGEKGAEPEAVNAVCGAGSSCGLNAITAKTTCAGTPGMSATQTQNEVPFGPAPGVIFSNGCASGFTTLLNSNVGAETGEAQCARFCTPEESYLDVGDVPVGNPEGANAKCGNGALGAIGGRGGHNESHQCRFVQDLFSNTDMVPASVGICMPTIARGGAIMFTDGTAIEAPLNSRGDCSTFVWGDLKAAWDAAAPNGAAAANAAIDAICQPGDEFLQKCFGILNFGCISLAESESLATPVGAARSGGQLLRDRFKMHLNATPEQLEELGL